MFYNAYRRFGLGLQQVIGYGNEHSGLGWRNRQWPRQKLLDDSNYLAVLTGQDLPQDQVSDALITLYQAKSAVDATNLRSPINGTVAEISDEAGIVVSPSHVGATIIDRNKLYVSISLSDSNIVNIKTGMSANITVTALPDLGIDRESC